MAGGFSDYTKNKVLNHILKVSAFTVPTNLYVAFYSIAPTDAGGGTELTGNGYARMLAEDWLTSVAEASYNTAKVSFAISTGAWSEAVAYGLFDAITSGNFLLWADLDTPFTLANNQIIEFINGALNVALD